MESLVLLPTVFLILAAGVFFHLLRRSTGAPVRGGTLIGYGIGLQAVSYLAIAFSSSPVLEATGSDGWFPMVGLLTQYIVHPLGIAFLLAGAYQAIRSLSSQPSDHYAKIIEHALAGVYLIQDEIVKFVNPRLAEIHGYDGDEMTGRNVVDFIAPASRALVRENMRKRMAGEKQVTPYGYVGIKKTGERFQAEVYGRRITYLGRPAIIGTLLDITDRTRADMLLSTESQILEMIATGSTLSDILDRLCHLIEPQITGARCSILLLDRHTKKLHIAAAPSLPAKTAQALKGLMIGDPAGSSGRSAYLREQVIVTDTATDPRWIKFRDLASSQGIRACWSTPILSQTGQLLGRFAISHNCPCGPTQHCQELIRRGTHLAGIAIEQKMAEEALRNSEERYRALYEDNPSMYFTVDPTGTVLSVNQFGAQQLGYSVQELVGRSVLQVFHEDDKEAVTVLLSKLLESPLPVAHWEFRKIRKDGSMLWVKETARVVQGNDGQSVILIVCEDITERRQAALALAAEKERLAVTLRSIGDGVITTTKEGIIVLINKVAESLTGWRQETAVGKPLAEIFAIINEKTRQRCPSPIEEALQSGGIVGLVNHTVLIAKDGSQRIIAYSGAPIRDKESRIIGVVLVFRDVTEKRKLEEEVLKAQKLESIGLLAGGIAHDFNNILLAILGNISLARLHTSPDSELFKRLHEAEKASLRAKDLTEQLLTFSKGGAPVKTTASIAELIKDSVGFALRGSNVRCQYSIPNDLWPVEIDEGQISQVIQNLIINADQAMPQGGIIHLRANNILAAATGLPPEAGRYVRITFDDEGVGIAREHLIRIFDPYFTTKQRGSGLGLATVYSIIKNHDGHITVDSELGSGTRFTIYLPASEKELPDVQAEEERILTGEGKILIMDDDEAVQQAASLIAAHLGYQVKVAKDGADAIELYQQARERGDPFDVVIMDLTVPGGMGGKESTQRLQQIDPQVRVIVSSGYSNDPIMATYKEHGFQGVIAKPYKIEELSKVLRTVMTNNSS